MSDDTLIDDDTDDGTDKPLHVLESGDVVHRFVIRRRVGSGGMGVVYAAHDPELERNVALKLLHPHVATRANGTEPKRLLREARAMAQLSHPNVITVHDAGVHEGQVYFAMELIEGQTLRAWLDEAPRSWREVLGVFEMAGRGLAAAHDKGLVHRDFKPENVMIDREGRVRVMDFGLVHSVAVADEDTEVVDAGVAVLQLTQRGKTVGTPAYMAPEQHLLEATDSRTDQFAYCVAMFEALHGMRPFGGDTLAALVLSVTSGAVRKPPRGATPAWLSRIVLRGLEVEPSRRWPDMHALLGAIDRGRRATQVRRIILGGAAAAAVAGSAWGANVWLDRQAIEACHRLGDNVEELWPGRSESLRGGLSRSGIVDATDAADRIEPWLEGWAAEWREARASICIAELTEAGPTPGTLRGSACLEERRRETEAILDALADADETLARDAIMVAATLGSPTECADPDSLGRTAWPAAEQLAEVTQIRSDLARVRALIHVGRFEEAHSEAQRIHARSEQLGWTPLVAEAQVRVGAALARIGKHDDAETILRAAYHGGGRTGADLTAAEAAIGLAALVGQDLARPREGLDWAEHARMHLSRVGADDGVEASSLHNAVAGIHFTLGELPAAEEHLQRALAIDERTFGSDHPALAASIHNLGGLARAAGRYEEAEAHFQRSIDIRTRALGPDHIGLVDSYASIAAIRLERRQYEEARRFLDQALALHAEKRPSDEVGRALLLTYLGAVCRGEGSYREAERHYREALSSYERTLGPKHPQTAAVLTNLGNLYLDQGEFEQSALLHEQALAAWTETFGADHSHAASSLTSLGQARLRQRRLTEAIDALERALAIRESRATPHEDLGETRSFLARALWDGGQSRERARELMRLAARDFAAAGEGKEDERADAEARLAHMTE